MSADRVFTTKPSLVGVRYVRYGSPSSFETIGSVGRTEDGEWYGATMCRGTERTKPTMADAVSYVVRAARL